MKSLSRGLAVILGCCVAAMAVGACGSSKSSSSASTSSGAASASSTTSASSGASSSGGKKQYVVGFSNPQGAQPILQAFQKSLVAAGARAGIKIVPVDAQLNPQKQVSDVNQMVAQHVNGIIVFPLAPGTLNPALNQARAAGIKVLGFNAIVQKPGAGASIAPYDADFDQGEDYQGAQLLAKYVADQLHGKGNVLGIGIGVPVPSIKFMVQNFQTYFKQYAPSATWLSTVDNATDDIAGGEKVAAEAVTRFHNNIQGVMAYNDDSAIGAAVALKNAGVQNPIIVGQNGDPQGVNALKTGRMSAMIDITPWRQALIAATMMNDLLTGKKVPNWVANPVILYTKSNVDSRLDWNKAVSEIQSGQLTCQSGGCPSSIL
jgi:ribose transport system substrate-binding protein